MHLLGVEVRKFYLINAFLICVIFPKETCIVGRREYIFRNVNDNEDSTILSDMLLKILQIDALKFLYNERFLI